jgi:hypothetical protein
MGLKGKTYWEGMEYVNICVFSFKLRLNCYLLPPVCPIRVGQVDTGRDSPIQIPEGVHAAWDGGS